jgi:hypothetical protein
MRTVHWLFVVSVGLFVSGIAFVVAAGRAAPPAATAPAAPPIEAVASTKQIMAGITGPSANVVYNAVGTIVGAAGVKEIAPQNDEEWAAVANSAAALVESGNLLLVGNRVLDNGDWVTMARELVATATVALKAAEAKSTEGILASGGDINDTCDNCHAKYQRQ